MGLKALVTRWVEEWAERELDARVDARLQALAGTDLKEQIGVDFDAAFRERFDALPQADLKELLDAYFDARADDFIGEKFDTRFFTWADLWADKNLRPRLDAHFDNRLNGRLDTLVQAQLANRIGDRIDRRIEQYLAAIRTPALAAEEPVVAEPRAAGEDPATPPQPTESRVSDTLVTAPQLERLLRDAGIKARRIRKLLKGYEAVLGHTNRYRLGDAAARILLREGEEALRRRKPARRAP
ncbi:hypothetical protein ACFYOK_03170 [Microbispora bryophytorum]|uniref:hypothetical protein n=1 Tax=Microbispora bryophytorum TaxID=1460882 RepID=UPI0033EB0ED2